jgi:nitronate monooxygenase
VTAGGGFGFLAAGEGIHNRNSAAELIYYCTGYDGAENFKKELNTARSDLGLQSQTPLPIGVGYLAWQLEKPNSPAVELLSIALDTRVQAVWFAFGSDLGRWVEFVRGHDKRSGNSHKTLVFAQISTFEEAKKAISEWKVDVVVAQGLSFLLFRILDFHLMVFTFRSFIKA